MVKLIRQLTALLIFVIFSANSFGEEIFSIQTSTGPVASITESQITIGMTTAKISDATAVFDRDGNRILLKDLKVGTWVRVSIIKIDGELVVKQLKRLR